LTGLHDEKYKLTSEYNAKTNLLVKRSEEKYAEIESLQKEIIASLRVDPNAALFIIAIDNQKYLQLHFVDHDFLQSKTPMRIIRRATTEDFVDNFDTFLEIYSKHKNQISL
jgi:hypothetical protein